MWLVRARMIEIQSKYPIAHFSQKHNTFIIGHGSSLIHFIDIVYVSVLPAARVILITGGAQGYWRCVVAVVMVMLVVWWSCGGSGGRVVVVVMLVDDLEHKNSNIDIGDIVSN